MGLKLAVELWLSDLQICDHLRISLTSPFLDLLLSQGCTSEPMLVLNDIRISGTPFRENTAFRCSIMATEVVDDNFTTSMALE